MSRLPLAALAALLAAAALFACAIDTVKLAVFARPQLD